MIKVKIKHRDNSIVAITINDHALVNREAILVGEAYDMICNSVSVLSQSMIIGLDEVLKLNVNYEIGDGHLELDLKGFTELEIEQAQVLLKTFEKSLESVVLSLDQMFGNKKRNEYISIINEEV